MKQLQITDEDHGWLVEEKERTGVPLITLIKFMVAEKRLKNEQTEETGVLPVLSK